MAFNALELAPQPAFEDEEVAERYLAHYQSIRGEVRTSIVRRHLLQVLALDARKLNVVDIGCGDARDAIWLAQLGHDVLAVDPSPAMYQRATESRRHSEVSSRIQIENWDLDQVVHKNAGEFDLVLSHGVIMYAADADNFIQKHLQLCKDGATLSLLTKNALTQPFRAVDAGDFAEASRLMREHTGAGRLGVTNRSHSLQELADIAAQHGALLRSWAGVRIFSDRSGWDPDIADPEALLELEWQAALDDSYKSQGALLHLVMSKGLDLSALPE